MSLSSFGNAAKSTAQPYEQDNRAYGLFSRLQRFEGVAYRGYTCDEALFVHHTGKFRCAVSCHDLPGHLTAFYGDEEYCHDLKIIGETEIAIPFAFRFHPLLGQHFPETRAIADIMDALKQIVTQFEAAMRASSIKALSNPIVEMMPEV